MASQPMVKTKTPGIYKRGNRYVVVWKHRGTQHKKSFRTMAEAREAKGQKQAGERAPQSRVTFEEYYESWIDSYSGRTARGFSDTTRTEYRRSLKDHALKAWGTWKLAEIEPTDVRDLFAKMAADGQSTAAIKKLRAPLSVLFATAVEDGLIRSNPASGARVPRGTDPDDEAEETRKAMSREELAAVLAALPKEWRAFFELLAHSGLRISEAVGLTWAHVELGERPRLLVREQVYRGERKRLKSKTSRRDIPLSPGMAAALIERRRDHYGGPDSPVFTSAGGMVLRPSNLRRRVLVPATQAAGLGWRDEDDEWKTWIGFHTFRHTCASVLFSEGLNVKQVSRWLGHAKASFTLDVYVHLMDDGLGDAGFLDAAVRPIAAAATEGNPMATQHP